MARKTTIIPGNANHINTVVTTITVSEMIKKLQQVLADHGDIPVVLDDPDTNLALGVDVQFDRHRADYSDIVPHACIFSPGGYWE